MVEDKEKGNGPLQMEDGIPMHPMAVDIKAIQNLQANSFELKFGLELLADTIGRAQMGAYLGKSYGGNRDIYTALGWPKNIPFDQYYSRYKRDGVASRIVKAAPDATWRKKPTLTDDPDNSDTAFQNDWNKLVKDQNLYHYLSRVDRISGIGEYGVLLIGLDDNKPLNEPVEKADNVIYLRPYSQGKATIQTQDKDVNSPRYGKPETYQLSTASQSLAVHWSRLIHIAEGLDEDDVLGTPRLEPVYNLLLCLELVSGSSGEMFWRGAYPGMNYSIDPDSKQSPDLADATEQIDAYTHGFQRYLKLKGIKVETLKPEIKSPKEFVQVLTMLIAAAKGMPQRILTGSERGDLASTQDEKAWSDSVDVRRTDYAEPVIIRPLADRLIEFGVLSEPKNNEYVVDWPDISAPTQKETAEIFATSAKALKDYSEAPDGHMIIPPDTFREMAPISEEQKKQAKAQIEGMAEDEANDSVDEEMEEFEEAEE